MIPAEHKQTCGNALPWDFPLVLVFLVTSHGILRFSVQSLQTRVKDKYRLKRLNKNNTGHPGAANTRNTRVSRSSFIVMAPCSSAVFNEFWLLIHFINLLSVFLFSYLSPVFLRLCLCLSCLYFSVFVLLMSTVFFILVNTLPSMSAVPWVPSFVIVFLTSIFPYLDSLFGLCLLNFTHL